MLRSPHIRHIGEVGAVIGSGRMPDARGLLPFGRVYGRKTGVALGPRMDFGQLQAIGNIHPLLINFSAADHRNLSGETPHRVASRDRSGFL